MKTKKNFCKKTISSTILIIIIASITVVSSVAASQTIFTDILLNNGGGYSTMTYDGTTEIKWYTEHPDNEFSQRNWNSLSEASAYYNWDKYYQVHPFTHGGRTYNYCYYFESGGACYFYIP